MYNILHIMPHMGPGVGKAVSALSVSAVKSKSLYKHSILLLEKPINFNYISICKDNGVDVFWSQEKKDITEIINNSDIVQLEWWHHPLVLKFLKYLSKIKIRLTIWSHISGCNYPIIPAKFVDLPEHFFFTTNYSYENPFWSKSEKERIMHKSSVSCGSGGFGNVTDLVHKSHSGFNVGYIGTLDFIKLNPEFVDFCSKVNISGVKFIMVGNPENKKNILQQAYKLNIENKFEFTGFTNNVKAEFERFDIFGYLLNSNHYGTTDNALLEAMGAGMAIIVLNQCGEKHIIKHMENGIIVDNKEEYGKAVNYLYKNPDERKRLGDNAKKDAFTELSPHNTMTKLHYEYNNIIKKSKKCYNFEDIYGIQPYQWFLKGLGKDRSIFEGCTVTKTDDKDFKENVKNSSEILKGNTKSSIPHFFKYNQNDEVLKYWNKIINEGD